MSERTITLMLSFADLARVDRLAEARELGARIAALRRGERVVAPVWPHLRAETPTLPAPAGGTPPNPGRSDSEGPSANCNGFPELISTTMWIEHRAAINAKEPETMSRIAVSLAGRIKRQCLRF